MKIGITGGIGTGKTTVANIFQRFGAYVIEVDKLGHIILQKGTPVYKGIIDAFGTDVLGENQEINRLKLAKKAFASSEGLNKLNSITHPQLVKTTKGEIQKIKDKDRDAIIIIDAAILIEGGFLPLVDKVILVKANTDIRIKRLVELRNMCKEDALRRIKRQRKEKDWEEHADFIVDNSGDIKETEERVKNIVLSLNLFER